MNTTYFIGSLVYLVFWLMYFSRIEKKHRNNIIASSIGMGLGGMMEGYFFMSHDWFSPERLTNSAVGIEDFISGFGMGGILMMLGAEAITRLKKKQFPKIKIGGYFLIVYLSTYYLIRFGITYGLELHSFYSLLIGVLLLIGLTLWLLPNILQDLVQSGLIITGISVLHLLVFQLVEPDFIQNSWHWTEMPYAKMILGFPILDLLWCFLLAMFIRALRLMWAATVEY